MTNLILPSICAASLILSIPTRSHAQSDLKLWYD